MMSGAVNTDEICPRLTYPGLHRRGKLAQVGCIGLNSQHPLSFVKPGRQFGQSTVNCGAMLCNLLGIFWWEWTDLPGQDPNLATRVGQGFDFDPGRDHLPTIAGSHGASEFQPDAARFLFQFTQCRYGNWSRQYPAAFMLQAEQRLDGGNQTARRIAASLREVGRLFRHLGLAARKGSGPSQQGSRMIATKLLEIRRQRNFGVE
ncbi:hypothetical protein [Novosphingobium sp. UBA6272]|uniref:hypothetical protein n=1 Tax=Novosphingobium sp. UBA6272 TaxID=1946984 RepID=UPI0032E5091C